ncbi:MAG TPA: glycosyl hydrolase family 28 protein, partial [bacterium]|nr:glycosyl hydrolase family 28 protein [bacterium]
MWIVPHRYVSPVIVLFVAMASATTADLFGSGAHSVRDFGAQGDGTHNDTAAVQAAIDSCAAMGGGMVRFSAGTYLCGSLHLTSRVSLFLDAGAVLKASPEQSDFGPESPEFKSDADEETSCFRYALLCGRDVEHVAVLGEGILDMNRDRQHGPKCIALVRCRHVEIRGITIKHATNYAISMLGTDYVNIDGVTIRENPKDGIDPDCCHHVRIANCHIETEDDAIAVKSSFSLGEKRSCENITVTNCFLGTECYCFRIGSETGGDIRNVAVSNCVMSGLDGHRPAWGGVSVVSVDGAHVQGIVASNLTMYRVRAPVYLRLGNRGRDMKERVPGSLRNISIENIEATEASLTSSITGIPEKCVEGITLSNVCIRYAGNDTVCRADGEVPELPGDFPCSDMYGGLPAYGLYCRHVAGLVLSNVGLTFADSYWWVPPKAERRSLKLAWKEEKGLPDGA